MSERYIVRCTDSHPAQPMSGIYAARLTTMGMVGTRKKERAAQYESELVAGNAARRLGRKFTGTVWGIEPLGVDV